MGFSNGNPGNRGNNYRGEFTTNGVASDSVGGYKNTDSMKAANAFIKVLNVSSLPYSMFAYHFVQKAPGPVIKNFFKAFEAVANVLAERIDTDSCENVEEYECGIAAKRIQDAMEKYR